MTAPTRTWKLAVVVSCLVLSPPVAAQERQAKATFAGHTATVESLSFSPDGKTLASASGRCSVKVWDVATGRNTTTLENTPNKRNPYLWDVVAFSPNGKLLAIGGSGNKVQLLDVGTLKGKTLLDEKRQCPETLVVFSSDGKWLVSGGVCRSEMKLFDVVMGKITTTFERTSLQGVVAVAFTPGNKTLVSVAGIAFSDDREIKKWDVATGKNTTTLNIGDYREPVVLSSDAKSMAAATYNDNNNVKLWDVATGKERVVLTGHAAKASSLAFSQDGKTLASGHEDGSIQLWAVVNSKKLATLKGHTAAVSALAFSAGGKMLASGGADKTIQIWDTVQAK